MAHSKYKDYSKEQLLEKIKQLEKKRYGLVWEDKIEDVAERCDRELPVLVERKDKEIVEEPGGPTNLLIEGDNYHALFALNFTHRRKIDVIYIDPPFNTGAKNWTYNNAYVDANDRPNLRGVYSRLLMNSIRSTRFLTQMLRKFKRASRLKGGWI